MSDNQQQQQQDMQNTSEETKQKTSNTNKRGFASMDKEKQRAIASKGGKAAHEKGTAHEFTSSEAAAAGRKGGLASRTRTTTKAS